MHLLILGVIGEILVVSFAGAGPYMMIWSMF
jgi:hypothetical protein